MRCGTLRGPGWARSPWLMIVAACIACGTPSPQAPVKVQPLDTAKFQELVEMGHGQPLLVNFWATWCEPCRQEFSTLDSLARDLDGRVRIVGVSVDDPASMDQVQKFLTRQQVSFPQYIRAEADDEVFINAVDPAWNGAVPSTFVYDVSGTRARRLTGQQTRESLIAAIEPFMAQAPEQHDPSGN